MKIELNSINLDPTPATPGCALKLPDPTAHNNFYWPTELRNICLYHYIHYYNISCNLK